jgi:hypothetical protein
MKYLLILSVAVAFAGDAGPSPIPPDKQEEISRLIIQIDEAEISRLQIQAQADIAIKQAEARVEAAKRLLQQRLAPLRKELHAEGCELNLDKTWKCPPERK